MAAKKKAKASSDSTTTKKKAAEPTRGKRTAAPAGSAGLAPNDVSSLSDSAADALAKHIEGDGGIALARYKDPLFGKRVVFAVLPLEKVERTIFQRDVSPAHVDKMVDAMKRTGAYLDPIIAVRDTSSGTAIYRSPNGGHRLAALARMGAKSVTALVIPDEKIAFKILALNTEKAHALKEKALEAVRMLKALGPFGGTEESFAGELEDPSLVTIGAAYEKRPRLSGSAYSPLTKRVDTWLPIPIADAVKERARRGDKLLAFDDVVTPLCDALRAKGFESPGLRQVVLSRIVHLPPRGQKMAGTFDDVFDQAIDKAKTLDVNSINLDGASAAAGGGDDE